MQHPSFSSCQIGDFLVTTLSDGNMPASLELLLGIETTEAQAIQRIAGINDPGNIHINCYLIRGKGRTILVDTGTGGRNQVGGQLAANLAAVGITPDDVDTILLTHCHPDHIGGLLDAEGAPLYQHAELYLHSLEAEYWRDDEKQKIASERGKLNFSLARQALDAYANSVRFFSGGEITEGILPVWLPGHTPGHTGFRISANDKSLLIWGDIVHYPHIQSAQPSVSVIFDVDPVQAAETRKKTLKQAVTEKLLVAGMHLDQTGFITLREAEDGFPLIDYRGSTDEASSR